MRVGWLVFVALGFSAAVLAVDPPTVAISPTAKEADCLRKALQTFSDKKASEVAAGSYDRSVQFYEFLRLECPTASRKVWQTWIKGDLHPVGGQAWTYHTALYFVDDIDETQVMDPGFIGDFLPYGDWKARCKATGTTTTADTKCKVWPAMLKTPAAAVAAAAPQAPVVGNGTVIAPPGWTVVPGGYVPPGWTVIPGPGK